MTTEVGKAYVTLIPSAKGFAAGMHSALGKDVSGIGVKGGEQYGNAFTKGGAGIITRGAKKMFMGLAAGAGIGLAVGKGLYEVGQSFEEMRKTIVVGTGASGKALEDLEGSAKKIGQHTPSSFADIGTAVADLNTRLGLTGKPLEKMASQVLNLSRITGTDLSTNIASTSRMFQDWGIKTGDQSKALDELFTASQATGAGVGDLAGNVVKMGAPLRQFGFSFEQSLALFGKFEKEGVNTSVVMAGLKAGLGKFSKAGKDPVKALKETEAAIKGAGSTGKANSIAIAAFGQRAGPDMAAAVREGRLELSDLTKQIKHGGGSIKDADKRTRTFSESWQLFKNKVLVKLAPMASKVFEGFTKGAAKALPKILKVGSSMARQVAPGVKAVFKAAKQMLPTLTHIASVLLAGLVPAFKIALGVVKSVFGYFTKHTTVFKVFAAILGALVVVTYAHAAALYVSSGALKAWVLQTKIVQAATKAWAAVQWILNAAMDANPIGLIVIAVVALIAVVAIIVHKLGGWGAVMHWLGKIAGTVWKSIKVAFDKVKHAVSAAVSWVIKWVKSHWLLLVGIFLGPFVLIAIQLIRHWKQIKAVVVKGVSAVVSFVKGMPAKMLAGLKALGTMLGHFFTTAFNNARTVVVRGATSIVTFIKSVPGKLMALGSMFFNVGKAVIGRFVDGLRNAAGIVSGIAGNVWDAVRGMINGAIDRINGALNFTISLPGPDLHVDVGNIPHLATGARATRATLAVIGEGKEPETVLPDSVLGGMLGRARASGNGPQVAHLTITNWEEGTGYLRTVAAGEVAHDARFRRHLGDMHV